MIQKAVLDFVHLQLIVDISDFVNVGSISLCDLICSCGRFCSQFERETQTTPLQLSYYSKCYLYSGKFLVCKALTSLDI